MRFAGLLCLLFATSALAEPPVLSPNAFDRNNIQHPVFSLGAHSTEVSVTSKQDYNDIKSSELDSTGDVDIHNNRGNIKLGALAEELEDQLSLGNLDSIPGHPEQDYPVFEEVPQTSFTCTDKEFPGYFADVEARCQVFHICETGGQKHSFLCPSGSIFNQKYLVCDWWYEFACENAQDFFADQQELIKLQGDQPVPNTNEYSSQNDGAQNNDNYNQQSLQGNEYFGDQKGFAPQNEIFHSAETGVPNRDKIDGRIKDYKAATTTENKRNKEQDAYNTPELYEEKTNFEKNHEPDRNFQNFNSESKRHFKAGIRRKGGNSSNTSKGDYRGGSDSGGNDYIPQIPDISLDTKDSRQSNSAETKQVEDTKQNFNPHYVPSTAQL